MKPRLDAKTRRGLALIYREYYEGRSFDDYEMHHQDTADIDDAMRWLALKAGADALTEAGLDADLILSWDE